MCTFESDISKKSRNRLLKYAIEFWRVYFFIYAMHCSRQRSQFNSRIGRVIFYNQGKHLGFLGVCEVIPAVAQVEPHSGGGLSHFSAT